MPRTSFTRRDWSLLPLCPAAAVAVAPASAKQKNGWRCSSRSMHEWCEDVHYWKLLSIIEQPQVRHCRSVAVTEEDKKITEHFRTWNIESTDLIQCGRTLR
ncbi:hypothetical protein BDL97_07G097900 [Sphagnum fallax]|nr:hypothetical protein BDL97_07G097900 [Sphagnum fallax]